MLLPDALTLLLFSMLSPSANTMPFESAVQHGAQPTSLASRQLQPGSSMFPGYRSTFLWSGALVDEQDPTNAPIRMNKFYADVSAQAQREMSSYSSQNSGQQFPGIWEFWQNNLHFTAIPVQGSSTLSFPLLTFALSQLGPLTSRGWTQHFSVLLHDPANPINNAMLINVMSTFSGDGVLFPSILKGYNFPKSGVCEGRPQIVNSHNDAAADKPCLTERLQGSSYLSQKVDIG